ncbi:amino acid/amide ABC transporter membrane protein 2, HAAT family [Actinomadura meyerae]|jgi:branched-chain amino acid transport system permease protein|uniref:Amino acid/amide ABC transporter membrane protein 2, HAAT family n=1 Tax=Actinomadura meyerae TaxID=240840 RepID=A0A239F6T1_9ACTN|nr:branched-chain amino acid ABC transporter permease [Actinomadura meyerae]SNS52596.1 amino acid/amide ABC transporter membrane protein 2, HAAT family [Actinomadura meyerae]
MSAVSVREGAAAGALGRFRSAEAARVLGTLVLTLGVIAWAGGDLFRQDLALLGATYALLALGMYMPFNLAGALSLAYSAYVAIGGYAVGLVATKTGWPLPVAYLLGAVASAALAVALGFATRRLSGFYLAAVTLLFGMAFQSFLLDAKDLTGGALGIGSIRPLTFFGTELDRRTFIALTLLVVWITAVAVDRIRRSPFGVALQSSRDVPAAVEAAGIGVPALRLTVLGAGAAIASVGGGLFTTANQTIGPDTFTLHLVMLAIFMPLLGGQGSAWGAVLGAVLVVELTFNLQIFERAGSLIFGVAVLAVLLIAPRGILGHAGQGARLLRRLLTRTEGTR